MSNQTPTKTTDFDAIKLKLASPDEIHLWSHGEVTKPETINYRTQKPEKDGLFCEKIFGPTKDWECYCGKYKKIRYKGIVCDKCGVEVTRASVRRERMGHIDLAVPASHIWFLRGVPSKIGLVLDMSVQALEKVIYFANFIITQIDEKLKQQALEELKQEFKNAKKIIEKQFFKQVDEIKSKALKEKETEQLLIKLNNQKEEQIKEIEDEYNQNERELKELKKYKIISEHAYHDLSLKYGYIFEAGIGAEAIKKLLVEIDFSELIPQLEKEMEESFGTKQKKIIKRIKLLKSLEKNKIRPEWMVLTTIPVIPPDLRPMVPLDGGRFATSDLNDLYRRVINRNNRLKRLKDLNAPEVITRNEKRMLQEAVDALIDNSARHTKTTTASTGQKRQLKSLADMLKGKQGRFRQNLLGKRIDYSGRSVIVVGPDLKLDECGIPKMMALELFKPFVISKLIKREFVHNIRSAGRFIESGRSEIWDILEEITSNAFVFLNRAPTLHRLGIQAFRPKLVEGKAIKVHPLVCSAFNADFDGDQMAVHVPLTDEAKKEAAEIMLSAKNLLKPATGRPIAAPSKDMTWGCFYMTILAEPKSEKIRFFSDMDEAFMAYQLRIISIQEKIKVRLPAKLIRKKEDEITETSVGRILFNKILPLKHPFYNQEIDNKILGEIVRFNLEVYNTEKTAELLDKIKAMGFKYLTKSGYSWGMDDLPVMKEKKKIIQDGDKKVDEIQNQYDQGLLTEDERHSKIIEVWTDIKDKIVKLSKEILDPKGTVFTMINSGSRGSWGQLTQMVGMKGLVSNPAGEIIELPVKANFKEGFDVLEYFISTHGTRKGLSDTALRTANAGYLTRRLVDVSQDVVINSEDCGDKEGIVLTKKESLEMGKDLVDRITGRFTAEKIIDPKTKKVIVNKNELITEEKARLLKKIDLEKARIFSILTCKLKTGACQKCYGYDLGHNKLVELGTAVGIIAAQSIGEPGTQLTMRTFHTGGVAGADITQGLPRVEELFEARPPKRKAFVADVDGIVSISSAQRTIEDENGKKITSGVYGQKIIKIQYNDIEEDVYKIKNQKKTQVKIKDEQDVKRGDLLMINENGINIKAKKGGKVKLSNKKIIVVAPVEKVKEYIIPPGYVLWVKDGDMVSKGTQLTEGSLDLHQLFKLRSKDAVQRYIVKEIQHIYTSQGQKLNDKHIEIIARQMFSRVYVKDAGDTDLLPGEIMEKAEVLEANEKAEKEGKNKAKYDELFLGISKVSLSTSSFLSAASFQETARVLINAAITGKVDDLNGLKENVIIGRLIPAGTGFRKKKK